MPFSRRLPTGGDPPPPLCRCDWTTHDPPQPPMYHRWTQQVTSRCPTHWPPLPLDVKVRVLLAEGCRY